ncbi:GIY-YIG nuclease family protein [Halomicrococcus gelatinilyticus]|uniref:GIY-YIG nuclease family protein n=1 Tax=Halomicrococcus gelatinilyticus TaxID=1702103 RepID=UPI002E0ED679
MSDGGTYTLLVELDAPATVPFGALGERDLPAGWYAYTGSALGTGGFARVERHGRVASGEHDARHWHVDYLLGHPDSRLVDDVRTVGADAECAVARRIRRGVSSDGRSSPGASTDGIAAVPGVGATDCDCPAHLHGPADRETLAATVRAAHDEQHLDG